MTNEFNVFEPVSGHHEHIWHGPTFSVYNNCNNDIYAHINNSNEYYVRTVCKQTTAWEVLWYIFFTLARLCESKEFEERKHSFNLHESCVEFMDAVRGLLPFVATLLQLELPQSLLSEEVVKSCITNSKSVTIQNKRKREQGESEAASSSLLESTTIKFDVSKFYTQNCTEKDLMDIVNTLCILCNELWCYANQITEYNTLFDEKHCVICINDITTRFTLPSVMDIKLGKIRYALSTPSEKIAQIRAKEAKYMICTSTNNNTNCITLLGLRICGARYVHRYMKTNYIDNEKEKIIDNDHCSKSDNNTNTKWLEYTKEDGYAVSNVSDVQRLINAFYAGVPFPTYSMSIHEHEENQMMLNIKAKVHVAVQALLNFFTSTTDKGKELLEHMAFVSSSLLVVYDTCTSHAANSIHVINNDSNSDVNVKVLLIDFARCSLRRLNYDEEEVGFVHGLQMFSSLLALPAS